MYYDGGIQAISRDHSCQSVIFIYKAHLKTSAVGQSAVQIPKTKVNKTAKESTLQLCHCAYL